MRALHVSWQLKPRILALGKLVVVSQLHVLTLLHLLRMMWLAQRHGHAEQAVLLMELQKGPCHSGHTLRIHRLELTLLQLRQLRQRN